MTKSFAKVSQSLALVSLFVLASCGSRPDSDTPAVTAPVTSANGNGTVPTTVVGETTPAPTTAVTPTTPETPVVVVPTTPVTPETPVVVVPTTPREPTTPETPIVVTPTEPQTPPVVVPPVATTSWAIVSTQFFTPNCVRCHGAAGGVNLETYESAKNYLEEIREVALVTKTMPPRKTLPTATTDILKAWLDAGAPQ